MKRSLIFVLLLLMLSKLGFAQSDKGRRVHLKVDLSGTFLKTLGPVLSNSEITSFDVNNWYLPGLDLSYRLNDRIHLGLNFTPSFDVEIEETWGLSLGPLDADLELDYETPFITSAYLKYYPFKKGLFASAAIQYLSKAFYEASLSPFNNTLIIGNNPYPGDVQARWEYISGLAPAFMLGYTFILSTKYSLDFGIQVPILASPYHREIDIRLKNGGQIDEVDLGIAVSRVRNEIFYYPVQFRIQFGMNLF